MVSNQFNLEISQNKFEVQMERALKLPIHKHLLYPSSRFFLGHCAGCLKGGPVYGGYRCNDEECQPISFHKECAESPPEMNHPAHPQHVLRLEECVKSNECGLCGTSPLHFGYSCLECDFVIDTMCARKPPPLAVIEHLKSHDHPLRLLKDKQTLAHCKVCKKKIDVIYPYGCLQCEEYFHVECVDLSPKVNHPSHPKHPLKLFTPENIDDDAYKICAMCGGEPKEYNLYHCSICNFSLCLSCVTNPPPLIVQHLNTHEHQLTMLPRLMSITCNACGIQGYRSPYLCLQCGFSIHRYCIDLPRVININRHDHRLYLSYNLGLGGVNCRVCRQNVNRYYGAFSCSSCPSYVVHTYCATRADVWNWIELEGTPEVPEIITSFEEMGDNLIKHFGHEEHYLRFKKGNDESKRCEACVLPVYSNPVYTCEECNFILHETCAKLPRIKRNVFHNRPFTLQIGGADFVCTACGITSSGFRYKSHNGLLLDVHCGSFSEPFMHDSHIHPLYYHREYNKSCASCCNKIEGGVLRCDTCDFCLDFRCANLPKTVKHICDVHPISLCYGEEANGKYWCDICEGEINPKNWFYTCSPCGVTLHVECVVGDFLYVMPSRVIEERGLKWEVVPNCHSSRPFCVQCGSRCKFPFFIKFGVQWLELYICSQLCFSRIWEISRLLLQ